MGDNLMPNGLLDIEVSEIVVHEADKPNSVVGLFDTESPGPSTS